MDWDDPAPVWVLRSLKLVGFLALLGVLGAGFLAYSCSRVEIGDDEPDLRRAILSCDVETVGRHLEADGWTGSQFDVVNATECGAEVLGMALDAGASLHTPNESFTPLVTAIREGDRESFDLLLASGADRDEQSNWIGEAPLLAAISANRREFAYLLLEQGADPNLADDFGDTPLLTAISLRDSELVGALLEAGADPNLTRESTGLFWPFMALAIERTGELPSENEDLPWAADFHGDSALSTEFTPLFLAAMFGQEEIALLLLDGGADPNLGSGASGLLPSGVAEHLGHDSLAEMLRSYESGVN